VHLLAGTARGLAYVHSRGILHGDVKPDVSVAGLAPPGERTSPNRCWRRQFAKLAVTIAITQVKAGQKSDHAGLRSVLYSIGRARISPHGNMQ
jgi:hypothetical protein